MEPTDLNSASADDARFDSWLQQNATLAPLPDDGFSARVLHSLPAPVDPAMLSEARRELQAEARRRGLFCAAGAIAGVVVLLVNFSGGSALAELWHSLGTVPFDIFQTMSAMGTAGIVLGSLMLVYWEQLKALRRSHA